MPEDKIREIIRDELSNFMQSDRYNFFRKIQIQDSVNIQLGRGTGTKLGTQGYTSATDQGQKLAFWNSTPVIQPDTISDPTDAGATYLEATAQSSVDKINAIIDLLQSVGLMRS